MKRAQTPEQLRREVMRQAAPLVDAVSEILREEVVAVIEEGPHTGREYTLPDGRTYRASAPGEPPASPTGVYPDSWGIQRARVDGDRVRGAAATDSPIGPKLELGDAGPPQVEPRPHVDRAIQQAGPRIRELIDQVNRR